MSAPVKHTCPKIDLLIHNVKSIINLCKIDKGELAIEVLYLIEDFENKLEDLRRDNDELRSWGFF